LLEELLVVVELQQVLTDALATLRSVCIDDNYLSLFVGATSELHLKVARVLEEA